MASVSPLGGLVRRATALVGLALAPVGSVADSHFCERVYAWDSDEDCKSYKGVYEYAYSTRDPKTREEVSLCCLHRKIGKCMWKRTSFSTESFQSTVCWRPATAHRRTRPTTTDDDVGDQTTTTTTSDDHVGQVDDDPPPADLHQGRTGPGVSKVVWFTLVGLLVFILVGAIIGIAICACSCCGDGSGDTGGTVLLTTGAPALSPMVPMAPPPQYAAVAPHPYPQQQYPQQPHYQQ